MYSSQVLFTSTKAARLCAEKYNDTSKMGNVMNVFVDVMGMFLMHSVVRSVMQYVF